ncbi:hypothetical protein [Paraburkholderia sp. HD33-4]|uniref:hypothetical protein n=1 Tax=Paraburkholderia sp. HD33-4 TaxID=2883242 RepID=UPI001F3BBDB9|nr:hypothetical protein [Paraburkholderia sp. HD33-4]
MAIKAVFDAYFRFLNRSETIHALPLTPQLDAAEQHPFEVLTASGNSGHAATVTETMALSTAGVSATVHPKLACLMECDCVSREESREDLRIKTVAPSRKALDYIEQLAACLEQVSKG